MSNTRHEIFEETSEAPVWYLQLWETLTSDASDKDLISMIDKSGWLRGIIVSIIPVISLVLLIAPGVNSWDAYKNYRAAENKNFDRTLDLVVNVLTTLASIAIMTTLMAGVVYFSPYILAGVLSLGLAYGLFNVVKHAYRAFRAHRAKDFDKRRKELWAIPRHILLTILNGLSLITHLHYAFNLAQFGGVFSSVTLPNGTFSVGEIIIYSCGLLVTMGTFPLIAKKVVEYNAETYEFVTHPITGVRNFFKHIWNRCVKEYNTVREQPVAALLRIPREIIGLAVEAIGMAISVLGHSLALMLLPLQLLIQGTGLGYKKLKEHYSADPAKEEIDDAKKAKLQKSTAIMTRSMLATKHAKLHKELEVQIDRLQLLPKTKKHEAKLFYLVALRAKIGTHVEKYDNVHTLQDIEHDAKIISPYLFQSFWKDEGKVEKIARMASTYDAEIQNARNNNRVMIKRAIA